MRPRNITIDVMRGTTKTLYFEFSDHPDITSAVISLLVKRTTTDPSPVLTKGIDVSKSENLEEGKFVISITPEDTASLDPRSYVYELSVSFPDSGEVIVPLQGSFKIYDSLSY